VHHTAVRKCADRKCADRKCAGACGGSWSHWSGDEGDCPCRPLIWRTGSRRRTVVVPCRSTNSWRCWLTVEIPHLCFRILQQPNIDRARNVRRRQPIVGEWQGRSQQHLSWRRAIDHRPHLGVRVRHNLVQDRLRRCTPRFQRGERRRTLVCLKASLGLCRPTSRRSSRRPRRVAVDVAGDGNSSAAGHREGLLHALVWGDTFISCADISMGMDLLLTVTLVDCAMLMFCFSCNFCFS
jgi:hypothetical protein